MCVAVLPAQSKSLAIEFAVKKTFDCLLDYLWE